MELKSGQRWKTANNYNYSDPFAIIEIIDPSNLRNSVLIKVIFLVREKDYWRFNRDDLEFFKERFNSDPKTCADLKFDYLPGQDAPPNI